MNLFPPDDRPLTVVALGGNALCPTRPEAGPADERAAVAAAGAEFATVARDGGRLLIVHGNGPQVGRLLAQEPAEARLGLDRDVAETQGDLGYLIAEAIEAHAPDSRTAALITRVLVDARDPAFSIPTKPVGPRLEAPLEGTPCQPMPGGGWRRVVASPHPVRIIEQAAIAVLLDHGPVVAGGGGGIALSPDTHGRRPRDGVIDKDRVAAKLAVELDAQRLVFVTDVDAVYDGFAGPTPQRIKRLTRASTRKRLQAGEFPAGSMGPKLESALAFADATGHAAVIAGLGRVAEALAGRSGTMIDG